VSVAPMQASTILDAAAAEIAAYLGRLPKACAFIAHSGGGVMALKATLQGSTNVRGLMLVDSAPSPGYLRAPRAASAEDIRRNAQQVFEQVMRASDGQRAALLRADAMSAVKDPDLGHQIAQWYVRSDRALLARATLELTTTDLRARLPTITVPCTVVHADQASLGAPPGWMRGVYQRQYAGAGTPVRMIEVADARHFLMLDQPEAFAAAVEAFVF
jgi:pimeloyl-[acyl-carrier protein] methyl ester esterase